MKNTTINPLKTEYVIVVGGEGSYLELRGIPIENTDDYNYLGVSSTNDGRITNEIATRIEKGNSAVLQLNGITTLLGTQKLGYEVCSKSIANF